MNIVLQLDEALDAMETAGAIDAAVELTYARTNIVAAVAAMRLAMDDPSCVDEIDPTSRPISSTLNAGSSMHRDPTADAALAKNTARTQHRDLLRKIADCHRAAMHGKVKTATSKAYAVAALVSRWLPRQATTKERMEAGRDLDPGCVSCGRTEVVKGTKRWEPVTRPGQLCDWCYRWKLRTGEAPAVEVVEQHHRGRVRVSA